MAFGNTEILIIVLIVLILFGAAAIPKLARSLGRAQGEFKKARGEFDKEVKAGESESSKPFVPPTATETSTAGADDAERIRQTAEGLDIPTEGKSTEELKQAIKERLG